MKPKLSQAVEVACSQGAKEECSERDAPSPSSTVLNRVLAPSLVLWQEHLPASLHQRLLQRLWDALLVTFMVIATRKPEVCTVC